MDKIHWGVEQTHLDHKNRIPEGMTKKEFKESKNYKNRGFTKQEYLNELKSKGKGKYLILFKDESKKQLIKDKIKNKKERPIKEFKKINAISVELDDEELGEMIDYPEVLLVEPDSEVQITEESTPWGVQEVKTPIASTAGIRGKGVKVAVFDTGISNHEDLVISGGISFVDGISSYNDDNGHGTHVAGTIAAQANGIGVVGVAPEASLYAVKVLDKNGAGTYSKIISALEWAIDNKINIVNMSLGARTYSQILQDEINKAAQSGILIFAAAGNDGGDGTTDTINYPARMNNVVAVGAVDQNGQRASFSSTGAELDITAPGVNITSTLINGGYGTKSGTSMACPHAVGAAALIWSKDLTVNKDVILGLMKVATTVKDNYLFYGSGEINIQEELRMYDNFVANPILEGSNQLPQAYSQPNDGPIDGEVSTLTDTTPPTTPGNVHQISSSPTSVGIYWNASSDNVGVTGYNIYINTNYYNSTVSSTSITISGLSPNSGYSITVKARDAAGNWSSAGGCSATTAACTHDSETWIQALSPSAGTCGTYICDTCGRERNDPYPFLC